MCTYSKFKALIASSNNKLVCAYQQNNMDIYVFACLKCGTESPYNFTHFFMINIFHIPYSVLFGLSV